MNDRNAYLIYNIISERLIEILDVKARNKTKSETSKNFKRKSLMQKKKFISKRQLENAQRMFKITAINRPKQSVRKSGNPKRACKAQRGKQDALTTKKNKLPYAKRRHGEKGEKGATRAYPSASWDRKKRAL